MSLFRNFHALPTFNATDHPTVITDKLRAMFAAPTHADAGSDVAIGKATVSEPGAATSGYESEQVTAYVDKFEPIGYLHGDQPLGNRA